MIQIADLIVMQEELTERDQFCEMVNFVKSGGFFTKTALEQHESKSSRTTLKELQNYPKVRLISITKFEDGQMFIHDGHHRTGSVWAGGREYLRDDEYVINEMRYSQYDEVNPDASFVTPFIPEFEVRLADFSEFKNTAIGLIAEGKVNEAVYYIRSHKEMYCQPRSWYYIHQIVEGISCSS